MTPPITAGVRAEASDQIALTSPGVGRFRNALRLGDVVRPGSVLGELERLGRRTVVVAPDQARGVVISAVGLTPGATAARPAVDFGAVLALIDPRGAVAGAEAPSAPDAAAAVVGGRVYRAPTSGRFYVRAAPGKPPFVAAGTELVPGATICLLEVMKTFHRVTYTGEPVRVREVLIADGTDVNSGDPLLALE